jgi:hypothetical protein
MYNIVPRFADRDMFMHFIGGAVGHESTSVPPVHNIK